MRGQNAVPGLRMRRRFARGLLISYLMRDQGVSARSDLVPATDIRRADAATDPRLRR